MSSWIFQGNPDRFDVDSYIAENDEISWSVRQTNLAREMHVGDTVFLWRASGTSHIPAGIIAVCTMLDEPSLREEDTSALRLWRRDAPEEPALRTRLGIVRRFTGSEELISRETVASDLILRELRILKMRQETNYILGESEAERLIEICGLRNTAKTAEGTHTVETSDRDRNLSEVYKDFGQAPNDDSWELNKFARRVRKGQPKFRHNLLNLYEGKCAISGWYPENVLTAAHIAPHNKTGINHSDNGILLRSDLHELFDDGLLTIDPETCVVSVHESLSNTPYWEFNGKKLRPRKDGSQPDKQYLLTALRSQNTTNTKR